MNKNFLIVLVLVVVAGVWFLFNGANIGGDAPATQDSSSLPAPALAVRSMVSGELGLQEEQVMVQSVVDKEWPDACLGLAEEGEMCAQVITPGFEVLVEAEGKARVYRTNWEGDVIRRER